MSPKLDWREAVTALQQGGSADELEHQGLEFKQEAPSLEATLAILAEASVCLANADGGTIVLGVRDSPDASGESLLGVAEATTELVRRGIFDRTRPPLTVFAAEQQVGGVGLLVIQVPSAVVPCATSDGKATRRLDRECRPFTPDQQREWLSSRGQRDWSAELSELGLDEVDLVELERLRERLRLVGRHDQAANSEVRLLEDLRLVRAGVLTNAGAVLLGQERALARSGIPHGCAYQFRPTGGSEATNRSRHQRPLLSALEHLLEAVDARSATRPLSLAGGVQLALVDYPGGAVRELLVNALVHRSYETQGTVEVEQTPDALVVSSPGGLVMGVTPANILTHPSTPRNRLLAETIGLLGVAERTGQGMDRAYRELLRLGKRPPDVADSGTLVQVRIAGGPGNESFARFVSGLPGDAGRDLETLLVLAALCERRTIGPHHLSATLQQGEDASRAVLARLAAVDGPIVEPTSRATYRLTRAALVGLGRAVRYHARHAGDFDEKVVDHVREYGTITNRTLQRLFDLSVWSARDALRDLQQRGLLVKMSDAKAGPGVQYGPGPSFPAKPGR